jgi:hypothetical protein
MVSDDVSEAFLLSPHANAYSEMYQKKCTPNELLVSDFAHKYISALVICFRVRVNNRGAVLCGESSVRWDFDTTRVTSAEYGLRHQWTMASETALSMVGWLVRLAADGQSTSSSWYRAPVWDPVTRFFFIFLLTITLLFFL